MRSPVAKWVLLGVSLGALCAMYSACNHAPEPAPSSSSSGIALDCVGSTFIAPIMDKWAEEYHSAHSDVSIGYRPVGSSAGIVAVVQRVSDFGASDSPMTDGQLKEAGRKIVQFPVVLGADVPAYNIPGVTGQLNFTSQALPAIYLGKITRWNDPILIAANPGVSLPAADIVPIHRSDGSGTTYIWTDYLSSVSDEWKWRFGKVLIMGWPVGRLGGDGNQGVADLVQQTPYSIGYLELTYASQRNLTYGKVQNAAGKFIGAELASISAAAEGAAGSIPDDFRMSIANAPGKDSYPISSFSWLLIPADATDPGKKKAIADFLRWVLTDGQQFTSALGYAPLPKGVIAKEMNALSQIE